MLFVSCAREDRGAATKLLEELDADGIPSVIDPDLTQGDPFWRDLVGEKLRNCQVMACLDSPRADQSPWVEQEQRAFHGPKVRIALEPIARSLPDSAEPVTVESRDAMRVIDLTMTRFKAECGIWDLSRF